jgi:hypothetical protein
VLVFGKKFLIPMDFIVPSLRIIVPNGMPSEDSLKDRLKTLMELEEDNFIASFN